MNAGKIAIVSVILTAAPAFAVAADETLQYIGSPFASLTITGNIANALAMDTPPENTGQIVLAAPLGDNLDNVAITPISWSFDTSVSLGIYLISELPSNSFSFTASTNAQGNLTAWTINAGGNDFGSTNTPSFASVSITGAGDAFAVGESGFECSAPPGGVTPCFNVSESNSTPGFWKAEVASVPELDAKTAYTALTLLLAGLAVLRGSRPRRSTRTRA